MITMRFVNVKYKHHTADKSGRVVEDYYKVEKVLQQWDELEEKWVDVPYLESVYLTR